MKGEQRTNLLRIEQWFAGHRLRDFFPSVFSTLYSFRFFINSSFKCESVEEVNEATIQIEQQTSREKNAAIGNKIQSCWEFFSLFILFLFIFFLKSTFLWVIKNKTGIYSGKFVISGVGGLRRGLYFVGY